MRLDFRHANGLYLPGLTAAVSGKLKRKRKRSHLSSRWGRITPKLERATVTIAYTFLYSLPPASFASFGGMY